MPESRDDGRRRAVLDLVDAIPPGRVMSYGDVARHVGFLSPRQVGQVMARYGHEVPWQRVVMADGTVAAQNALEQLARLRADKTPIVNGRVDMDKARWEPSPRLPVRRQR